MCVCVYMLYYGCGVRPSRGTLIYNVREQNAFDASATHCLHAALARPVRLGVIYIIICRRLDRRIYIYVYRRSRGSSAQHARVNAHRQSASVGRLWQK